jgi:hypothetical protein
MERKGEKFSLYYNHLLVACISYKNIHCFIIYNNIGMKSLLREKLKESLTIVCVVENCNNHFSSIIIHLQRKSFCCSIVINIIIIVLKKYDPRIIKLSGDLVSGIFNWYLSQWILRSIFIIRTYFTI